MNKILTNSRVLWLVCIFLLMQTAVRAQLTMPNSEQTSCFNKITKEEMEFLLKDVSPLMLKRLEDSEVKKQQIKSLREMLAMACAARKEGLASDSKILAELEDIRIQTIAVNYDREINKNKGQMPTFAFIGEDRVKAFWNAKREEEFQEFFKLKVELGKDNGITNLTPSEEDIKQAREYFAKTRIYAEEAETKKAEMSSDFKRKVDLAVKLQQAQYLSGIYAKTVLAAMVAVSDEEIQIYIANHPEFDTKAKKAKAEEILRRAKSGEDFAKLAAQFSEDPGSRDKGGLYENVPQGQMIPEFEQAALALETGQIAPILVETKFGYHIIKLEKKGVITGVDGQTKQIYDVRHILISTDVKDPENPFAPPKSVKDFVRDKLEAEKQNQVLEKVVANNPVEIAEDFVIPKISDEQLQQQVQQQVQQQTTQAKTEVVNETLPKQIKSYLDRIYKGWKLSPSQESCRMDMNNGIVKGNFNADKKLDYAVKFTREKKDT